MSTPVATAPSSVGETVHYVGLGKSYRFHTHCRVCKTALPEPFLSLGEQPMANALREPGDARPEFTAPLAVTRCPMCSLVQLTVTVDPETLYPSDYPFRSGQSAAWLAHCKALAALATQERSRPGMVLDVAANDGALLRAFYDEGWGVAGVDPAPADIGIMKAFWSEAVASEWGAGSFNLIIAQNVFGHVDEPIPFLKACAIALADDGRLVIEVPHVGDLITNGAFDTIYHEHLSYWSLNPLLEAAAEAGLSVVKVEKLSIHGGSRRYWLAKGTENTWAQSVEDELVDEQVAGLWRPETYREFALMVAENLALTKALLDAAGERAELIWAYGANAKGAVMLNALQLIGGRNPRLVVDDAPSKHAKLMPGVDVLVSAHGALAAPDVLWLTSWNNAESLMQKAKDRGFRGKFLVTSPTPRFIDP